MDTYIFTVTHPETGQEVERVIAAETRTEAAARLRSIGFILGEDDTLPSEYETPPSSDEAPPSENQAPPKTVDEEVQETADNGDANPDETEPAGEETPPVETDVPADKPTRKPHKPKA